MLYLTALALYLLALVAAAAPPPPKSGSAVFFPVAGNVYPKGSFYVTILVGQPPKPYYLDIDTGSDLTWLQCDVPCVECTPAPHVLYKPKVTNLVTSMDPLCTALHASATANKPCDYQIQYADGGSSKGVLVRDSFPLKLTNGTVVAPNLVFGCGYNQKVKDASNLPSTDGILGLGLGSTTILTQLRSMGVTQNVVGHCFSAQGGGFLFFGGDFLPSSGIVWQPMLRQSNYYSLGSADLQFGGLANANMKGLQVSFDSGSTYTYLNSPAYKALLSLIQGDLAAVKQVKVAPEEKALPVCWKGATPFKSIRDAASFFKPLVLSFTNGKAQFPMRPESYLILTEKGNVCLGILNGAEAGLGNLNLIGDISLHDKMVIYDNERRQIGWAPANCNRAQKF